MSVIFRSTPAPEAGKELNPPCGGSWIRNADGSLTPADEYTAIASGLFEQAPVEAEGE
jgi:hypothetical protein